MARPTGRQSITAGRSSARRRTETCEGERRRRASHHVTAFGLPDERPLPFASSRVPRLARRRGRGEPKRPSPARGAPLGRCALLVWIRHHVARVHGRGRGETVHPGPTAGSLALLRLAGRAPPAACHAGEQRGGLLCRHRGLSRRRLTPRPPAEHHDASAGDRAEDDATSKRTTTDWWWWWWLAADHGGACWEQRAGQPGWPAVPSVRGDTDRRATSRERPCYLDHGL